MFAERGYAGASLRTIAARAGVDPGMVRHFFGGKAGLFHEALAFPFDPAVVVPQLLGDGLDGLGDRVVRFFLSVWDDPGSGPQIRTLVRSAATHEETAAHLRTLVSEQLLGRVAEVLPVPDPALRASFAAAQLVGLGFARYVVRVEPLASASTDDVVAAVAPTVQRYLTVPDLQVPALQA